MHLTKEETQIPKGCHFWPTRFRRTAALRALHDVGRVINSCNCIGAADING